MLTLGGVNEVPCIRVSCDSLDEAKEWAEDFIRLSLVGLTLLLEFREDPGKVWHLF
jgi:hypothetical protein